jgi:hypothetical protein
MSTVPALAIAADQPDAKLNLMLCCSSLGAEPLRAFFARKPRTVVGIGVQARAMKFNRNLGDPSVAEQLWPFLTTVCAVAGVLS